MGAANRVHRPETGHRSRSVPASDYGVRRYKVTLSHKE